MKMKRARQVEMFGDSMRGPDLLYFERRLTKDGYTHVAGVDEAGRGPLAGPVVAAAVVLPPEPDRKILDGLNDSKLLSEKDRVRLYDEIHRHALAVGIGAVEADVIDKINILQASLLAMKLALESLDWRPDFVLVDGNKPIVTDLPQNCLIKGDRRSLTVAGASVVAKVTRDRIMAAHHETYPPYLFHKNKGYGTREHIKALASVGPCLIHRKTFGRVSRYLAGK